MNPIKNPIRATGRVNVFRFLTALACIALIFVGLSIYDTTNVPSFVRTTKANGTYHSLSSGNLNFNITALTANQISTNDNWSGVSGVEGYFGQNLTATHGIDPQTVLGTEFAGDTLPTTPTQINANKSNPSAYNAGGLAEFDSGTYLAIGFQGNVQANPYLVFYLNTMGRSSVTINYDVTDIDSGNNNAVSPVALQYRVGSSGLFTNLPDGYIADATDGPNIGGRVTTKSVVLPSNASNQPQVQVRILTTNAANSSGSSTPDEWVGVNNVVVSSLGPTVADISITGRVFGTYGRPESQATVTLTDMKGGIRYTRTNTFGYYRFVGVQAGDGCVLSVHSRRFQYEPVFITLLDDMSAVNFVPIVPKPERRSLRF